MRTRIIQSDPHEPQSAGAGLPAGAAVAVPRSGLTAFVRRRPLLVFFALAFAITWAPTPFGIFMAAGPLIAAVIVTAVVDGRRGLRELGSRMIRWRVGWQWYAAALLIPLAVVLGTRGGTAPPRGPGAAVRGLPIPPRAPAFPCPACSPTARRSRRP